MKVPSVNFWVTGQSYKQWVVLGGLFHLTYFFLVGLSLHYVTPIESREIAKYDMKLILPATMTS